jgi:hypothetical protein
MTAPFASVMEDPRRITYVQHDGGTLLAGGYMLTQWRVDGDGEYGMAKYPPGYVGGTVAVPHTITGGSELVSEENGVRWIQDIDHPAGARLNPDGSIVDEASYDTRVAGWEISFYKKGTHRLCVNGVNAFGRRNYELLGKVYYKGPADVVIHKGGIFVLVRGGVAGIEVPEYPHVIYSPDSERTVALSDGGRGVSIWKEET